MMRKDFGLHINSQSCLVVASGPSAQRVNELDTYGHIITLNRTLSLVKGLVDYAVFQDVETLKPVLNHLHKCSYLVVPEKLHEKGGKVRKGGARIPLDEISWLPKTVRMLVYPHKIPRLKNLTKVIRRRRVPFFSGGCIALFVAASLGFQNLFCLGFDGGSLNFENIDNYSYDNSYKRDRLVAKVVSQEFGVRIYFWEENICKFTEYQVGDHENSNLSS